MPKTKLIKWTWTSTFSDERDIEREVRRIKEKLKTKGYLWKECEIKIKTYFLCQKIPKKQ